MNQAQAKEVFDIIREQRAKRREAGGGYKGPGDSNIESSRAGDDMDFMALVKAHQAQWGTGYCEAYNSVCRAFPEKHQQYIDRANQ